MADLSSAYAFLGALKTASEIVKTVKDADYDLDKAILKEKIAGLVDVLLDAKTEALETVELINEKDTKIASLEKAFEFKGKIERKGNAYYEKTENGGLKINHPLCSGCWDSNAKAIYLSRFFQHGYWRGGCPVCRYQYDLLTE